MFGHKKRFHEPFSGQEAWERRLASAAACQPLGGPPAVDGQVDRVQEHAPDPDRQPRARGSRHETGPTVCPTRVGAPQVVQQPKGGRWPPVTEEGLVTADLSALGQGGALSPQRCLYITGLELFHLLVIAASADQRFDAVRWRAEAHRYVCDAVRQVSSTSSSAGKDDYMYARRR